MLEISNRCQFVIDMLEIKYNTFVFYSRPKSRCIERLRMSFWIVRVQAKLVLNIA